MEKINIAELLKDCPKGMELDCTMFDDVTFYGVSNEETIVAKRELVNQKLYLDSYGAPFVFPKDDRKCVIFPKGKTTWEGFVPPCKFKVGDRVRNKNYKDYIYDIHDIVDKGYRAKEISTDSPVLILFGSQEDNYELVPNKFDINTLVPFESRVLVREGKTDVWQPSYYGFLNQRNKRFYTTTNTWSMCIPYNEDTKHLIGTTNDCEEFYKTWEEKA